MKKMLKLLGLILGGVLLFELALFKVIVPAPVSWIEFEGDGFRCMVPAGPQSFIEEHGWQKRIFTGMGQLYISTRPREGSPDDQIASNTQYIRPSFEAEIKIFDDGRFFMEKYGKGRRYIYLFTAGDRFFWVENSMRTSSLRTYKDVVDHVIASLVVDGRRISPDFAAAVKEVNRKIIWHSQSQRLLGVLMFGLPLGIVVLVIIPLVLFGGKLPDFHGRKPVKAAENLFAWFRTPFSLNGTLAAVALFDDRFVVYTWRKPRVVITREEGHVSSVTGEDKIVVRKGRTTATIDIEHARSWLAEMSSHGILKDGH